MTSRTLECFIKEQDKWNNHAKETMDDVNKMLQGPDVPTTTGRRTTRTKRSGQWRRNGLLHYGVNQHFILFHMTVYTHSASKICYCSCCSLHIALARGRSKWNYPSIHPSDCTQWWSWQRFPRQPWLTHNWHITSPNIRIPVKAQSLIGL